MNFTRDRGQLAAAIDTLGLPGLSVRTADPLGFAFTQPGGPGSSSGTQSPRGPLKGPEMEESLRDVQNLQRQSSDEQGRGRVTKLMTALAGMGRVLDSVRGRKHVLFFSEGFETRLLAGRASGTSRILEQGSDTATLDAGTNQGAGEAAITGQIWKVDSDARFGSSSLRDQFSSSLGFFPRSDAVLDAIDIGGLRAEGDAAGPRPASGADALSTMASETGGDFVRNANSLGGELKAVSERTGLVYLLVYQPKGLSKPGTFHKLRVDVKAPVSKVVARSGYYEPRPYASLSPLEKLLASGDLVTGGARGESVAGRLVVAPFASPAEVAQVPIVLELPGAGLFAGDKAETVGVQIYAYAADAAGTLADYVVSEAMLDLAKVRPMLEAGGIKFYGTLYLAPGDYRIHVLACDAATGRAGVFSSDVRVPAIPGGAATVLPPFFPEPAGRWVMVRANPRAGRSDANARLSLRRRRRGLHPGGPAGDRRGCRDADRRLHLQLRRRHEGRHARGAGRDRGSGWPGAVGASGGREGVRRRARRRAQADALVQARRARAGALRAEGRRHGSGVEGGRGEYELLRSALILLRVRDPSGLRPSG